jgi:predicted enzyme related to lactoylglutathione lyase
MPKKAPSARKPGRTQTSRPSKAKPLPTPVGHGWITHTDLSSRDPLATKTWCAKVFGWTIKPVFPTPAGDYHLFAYGDQGGGGIRACNPGESPGSIPFVHVDDAKAAFKAALRAGAVAINRPERVGKGLTIAMVLAPGGVAIGLTGP